VSASDAETLLELEALRALKARYFRSLDTQDWEAYAEVFTEDAEMDVSDDVGDGPGARVQGRAAIARGVAAALSGARTVHHGHMPELELLGPDTARGIWAMEDYVEWPGDGPERTGFRGYGHYHETYRKQDGEWRIASMRLTRLRRDPLA